MIIQKITKWGNSLGIRLPQEIIKQLGWQEGIKVTLSMEDNSIIVSATKPKYCLEDLLKEATPQQQHEETNWGEAIGEESL